MSSGQPSRSEASSSAAQQQAAAAALARLEKKKDPTPQQRSAAIIRAQALKELEQEKQDVPIQKISLAEKSSQAAVSDQLAVNGVFYKCPLIGNAVYFFEVHALESTIYFLKGPEVLPKKEIEKLIKEFLYQQLEDEEAGLTACLVIHTVNKPPDKVHNIN